MGSVTLIALWPNIEYSSSPEEHVKRLIRDESVRLVSNLLALTLRANTDKKKAKTIRYEILRSIILRFFNSTNIVEYNFPIQIWLILYRCSMNTTKIF